MRTQTLETGRQILPLTISNEIHNSMCAVLCANFYCWTNHNRTNVGGLLLETRTHHFVQQFFKVVVTENAIAVNLGRIQLDDPLSGVLGMVKGKPVDRYLKAITETQTFFTGNILTVDVATSFTLDPLEQLIFASPHDRHLFHEWIQPTNVFAVNKIWLTEAFLIHKRPILLHPHLASAFNREIQPDTSVCLFFEISSGSTS